MLPLRKSLKPGKAGKVSRPEKCKSIPANIQAPQAQQAPDIPARFQSRVDRFDIVGIISAILLIVLFWALFKGLL